ncbi:MAG: 16S rRNA (cytosine(1402)-N(4))-methyltransferase RsmH [Burkholderiaceae bacterium]
MPETDAVGARRFAHRTVLLDAAVDGLAIEGERREGRYVDCTFGRGGHSRLILERLAPTGRLLAFDRDPEAIASAGSIGDPRFAIVHERFTALRERVAARGWTTVDGILFDLGISSPQIDDAIRGFSFRYDGPLDMRMDPSRGISAAAWLNTAASEDIERVIRDHGEERFAFQIAKAIVARRTERPLSRTRELAELVATVIPRRSRKDATQDPATRTFQAVRIHVNQELEELEEGLSQAMDLLAPDGRLAVIAFHSLEDRIVKRFIAGQSNPDAQSDPTSRRLPIRAADLPQPALLAIARVKPDAIEVGENARSRSAVLRIAERTAAPRLAGRGHAWGHG